MSSFTSPLILEPLEDGARFRLVEEFDYEIGDLGSGRKIAVPKDFVTDFASVPRIFWNIIPPWGKYGKAAVLHDWLYTKQEFTRSFSDDIFLEAMEALGVSWLKRMTIYWGVRSGGWIAWCQHKKNLSKKSQEVT